MKLGDMHEQINDFAQKLDHYSASICPSFLTPNSRHMGIIPGHNLDLFQVTLDFKVNRTDLLMAQTPNELKDMSKADLTVIK